ncbi:hypothetical protein [Azospirillum sp. SYSU D00513]|uniref:hypothetical protein n=1 Tax=Azospirillum sp. SYSU D00513 TaxID=2812561 RepID=UPI001A965840|nr:hypothetical protein [Azospirillum sp. SYSU D00513]
MKSIARQGNRRAAPRTHALGAMFGAALLASCANPAAEQALFAQNALTGMPKETLLSCAGVPDRQATAGNMEYFTYSSSRIVTYPGSSLGFYGGPWGPHYGYGAGFPAFAPEVASLECEATFTLRNGVVERIVYGGHSGAGSRLGQCYTIVQNCLALVPPPPAGQPVR